MLAKIKASLAYRSKWARFGVFRPQSPTALRLRIGRHRAALAFPDKEHSVQEHEFHKICIDDCYRLGSIIGHVATVLDIGANIGLFAIAARSYFKDAKIHCYEPNPDLAPFLDRHLSQIDAIPHHEAVGYEAGSASIVRGLSDSLDTKISSDPGIIPKVAFATAVGRLGYVDLLKLDCEGAEWDIFQDAGQWQRVRNLAMEFHLWAKKGATIADVYSAISAHGFTKIQIEKRSDESWGLAFASRD